jgi:hypothetical protein
MSYSCIKIALKQNSTTIQDIGLGNYFLNRTPVTQDLTIRKGIKIALNLNFCASKEIITRIKRQTTEWKKIIASFLSDKGRISRL